MSEEKRFTELEAHRHFAVSLFNHTWTLIEKPDRTPAEDDEMLHAAHASRHHWSFVGDASNLGIGEWQISRVNAVLQRPIAATYHAQRYLDLAKEHDLGAFHLGFAYEALARAAAIAGNGMDRSSYLALAREWCEKVEEAEDRELLASDLGTIPA